MVNANVVISVSAVLVALILTIVVVMRQSGDPTENFSVTVSGTYEKEGTNYAADMYYCTGVDCQFYGAEGSLTFPGYFALVGFDAEGDQYVTEHSIGKTFKFTGGVLQSCFASESLDTNLLAKQVAGLTSSFNSESKQFEIDGMTYTMKDYSMNPSPAGETPKVLGLSVPSAAECNIANGVVADTVDATTAPVVGADISGVSGRRLWGGGSLTAHQASQLASFGYSGAGALPSGFYHWSDCITSNSVARFGYSYPTMVLSYAGTDDMWDAMQDLKTWGHGTYHGGFWDYVIMTKGCVDSRVDLLRSWGIDIDYVVGHSLGGAAATIYKQINTQPGMNNAKVITFGAPKTTRNRSCLSSGTRIYNEKDPVASNGLGLMGSFSHDINEAKQAYVSSSCSGSFWGVCYRWSENHNVRSTGCAQEAGGCSWFFDCVYNVGKHSLSTYQQHDLGFGV